MRKLLKKLADWWEGEYTEPFTVRGPGGTFNMLGAHKKPWLRRIVDASVAWTQLHSDQLILGVIVTVMGGIALAVTLKLLGIGTQP